MAKKKEKPVIRRAWWVTEYADILGVSRHVVLDLVLGKKLAAIKLGGKWLVTEAPEDFLAKQHARQEKDNAKAD